MFAFFLRDRVFLNSKLGMKETAFLFFLADQNFYIIPVLLSYNV